MKRKIPNFLVSTTDANTGSGVIDYVSDFYGNAYLEMTKVAKAAKLGIRLITNETTKKHIFEVYKGRDLTDGNTAGNEPCIFSREHENVAEQEFTSSNENYKTTAFVGGEDQKDVPRKVAETGAAFSGLDRDEVFINATNIKQKYKDENDVEITLTDPQYIAILVARGDTDLEGFARTLAFASKINQNGKLVYGVDFDLGDRVTCIEKRWGVRINARITEVTETYQGRVVDIDITFGESLPTLINQIRQLVK
jgi:hypothetical protein